MDPDILQNNAASLARLRAVIDRLDDVTLRRSVRDGWTVSALLVHLAHWDHSCLIRWDAFRDHGSFVGPNDDVMNFINDMTLPILRAVPARVAAAMAIEAAEEINHTTAALSPEAIAYVMGTDCEFMLDRAAHRHEHLDEIEEMLAW